MTIHRRGETPPSPSGELRNFTDREDAQAVLMRLIDRPASEDLPLLMYYGVGGRGKTWLLKHLRNRLRAEHPELPVVFIDCDPVADGSRFRSEHVLLAEIWLQIGPECPRFDLAYSMIRHKQGYEEAPGSKHSGKASLGGEFLKECASAAASFPGGNLLIWAGSKLTKPAMDRFKKSKLYHYLESKHGDADWLELNRMSAQEIYPTLAERLGADLDEQLAERPGKKCRLVVFIDTFETYAPGNLGDAQRRLAEEPIRSLFKNLTCAQIVIAGRDRLSWDEDDSDWRDPKFLEQYPLDGLSFDDSIGFLKRCGVTATPLHESILRLSAEREDAVAAERYLPYALGLCVDVVLTERRKGRDPDPDVFDLSPGDYKKLADRFLRSLHDREMEEWIRQLAHTPRFDETAARAAFSTERSAAQTAAWDRLLEYSFVEEADGPGWYRLHTLMVDALTHADPESVRRHTEWRDHWRSRSANPTDQFATLAWSHDYALDPKSAIDAWAVLAKTARRELRQVAHHELLSWWTHTGIENRPPIDVNEARALNTLGVENCESTQGNRTENLLRAIRGFRSAQIVWTESSYPSEWAMTQNNLAVALANLPTGDEASNLREAIEVHRSVLRVYTESSYPSDWAATQNNLGTALAKLPTGDRASNLHEAIEAYRSALRVRTESSYPSGWAATQNNLGITLWMLPTGDRASNLREAIEAYRSALSVYTESSYPSEWAMTQNNLAVALADFPTGDRASNLREAIEAYRSTLRVRTESSYPSDWAATQNNLGTALAELPTGDRASNLREAIEAYRSALRVRTESSYPPDWAATQNNLGTALAELPTGDRASNLREAIAAYRSALRVRTESSYPSDWASTLNNLGLALAKLPTGDRASNLREAIEAYRSALRVYKESSHPSDWAMTQYNLGNALAALPTGDRASNLREAIEAYRSALRVYAESSYPSQWAMTQNNLGNALADLSTYDRASNLREAIEAYRSALRVYTESSYPWEWAGTQSNLGAALNRAPTGDRSENLWEVIKAYRSALRVYTELSYPSEWAKTQNNLGAALFNLPTGDRAANLREAIDHYQAALTIWAEEAYPKEHVIAVENLKEAQALLAERESHGSGAGVAEGGGGL